MSAGKAPFESRDINFGALVALIGVLFILLGGTILVTRIFDRAFRHMMSLQDVPRSPMIPVNALPPEPRLQVNPTVDYIRLRDIENVTLNNYAWIDPAAGKVRIPIERAMAILAERSQ